MGKGRNALAVTQHCCGYQSDKCTKDIVHTQAASFKRSIESVDFSLFLQCYWPSYFVHCFSTPSFNASQCISSFNIQASFVLCILFHFTA